ncbi:hypothetical protein EMCRGX_G017620 [Ephydatia muelleri]
MAYSLRFLRQLILIAIVAVILLLLWVPYNILKATSFQRHGSGPDQIHVSTHDDDDDDSSTRAVSQWVVTTSRTSTPSSAVHVILNSTEDWCVLVLGQVAGLKFHFSWTKDTVHLIYLPLEALSLLPFKLATLTSLDIRNIGHLYAIANGARVVLDLEDGIVPIRVDHTYLPVQADKKEYTCPNLEEKDG